MRKEKQYHMDAIQTIIEGNPSFLLLSYQQLQAKESSQFRRDITKTGGMVEVLPKRMLVIAAKKTGVELDLNALPGHIAVVFTGKDPIETTKTVFNFRKGSEQKLSVVGGRIDNAILSGEQVEVLSKLPGRDEMRAQLIATLVAPMSQTISVMNALVSTVVYCLDNKVKQSQ